MPPVAPSRFPQALGQPECNRAHAGKYVPLPGYSAPLECPPGTYQVRNIPDIAPGIPGHRYGTTGIPPGMNLTNMTVPL